MQTIKMTRVQFEMQLLEEQVEKAWQDETILMQAVLKRKPKPYQRDTWCQGITGNIQRRIYSIFEHSKKASFCYKNQMHVVLYVKGEEDYIVDGTIRQFLPHQIERVFKVRDYPLHFEKLQTW